MDGLIQEIPVSEKTFLRVDLNGHLGNNSRGHERQSMDRDLEK